MSGGEARLLVPVFSEEAVARLIRTKRPTLIAGVPTLYEALARDPVPATRPICPASGRRSRVRTRSRRAGARSASRRLVADRGGRVRLLEGYGLTEAVTAIMGTPMHEYREGSVGVPFPDTLAKICRPGTDEELSPGEDGEICVSGPAVMVGYLDEPGGDRRRSPGRTGTVASGCTRAISGGWTTTASSTSSARLKRMIKSSGFNVYPAQVEAVLYQHRRRRGGVRHRRAGRGPGRAGRRLSSSLSEESRGRRRARRGAHRATAAGNLIKWSCPAGRRVPIGAADDPSARSTTRRSRRRRRIARPPGRPRPSPPETSSIEPGGSRPRRVPRRLGALRARRARDPGHLRAAAASASSTT